MANGWRTVLFLICSLLAGGIGLAQDRSHPAAGLPIPQSSLSPEEQSRALEIATPEGRVLSPLELSPDARRVEDRPRLIVSRIEALDAKDEGRLALVTLYQYDGSIRIQRLVDLEAGRIISEDRAQDVTAPLAPVELDFARALVLADERVARLVAPHPDIALEFLLSLSTERDPEFQGRRVVAVLFRTPRGYLEHPGVYVDLTEGRVVILER